MCSMESTDFRHPSGMLYRDQRTTRSINILQRFNSITDNIKKINQPNSVINDSCDSLQTKNIIHNLSKLVVNQEINQCTCCVSDKQIKRSNGQHSKSHEVYCDNKNNISSGGIEIKNKRLNVNFTNCDRYIYIKKRSQMDLKINNYKKFSLSK